MLSKLKKIIIYSIFFLSSLTFYFVNLFFIIFLRKSKEIIEMSKISLTNKCFSTKNKREKKALKLFHLFSSDAKILDIKKTFLLNNYVKYDNNNDKMIVILPFFGFSLKNIINSFCLLFFLKKQNIDFDIFYNKNILFIPFVILFYKRIKKIDISIISKYESVIYNNLNTNLFLNKWIIPNIAILSQKFYCSYSKYVADNFPWINFINDFQELLKKREYSITINNFGYINFLKEYYNDNYTKDSFLFFNKFIPKYNFLKPVVSIVFPIWNNCRYLYNRSFKSLLFNKCFNIANPIFVDDGSNNKNQLILNELYSQFSNITKFQYHDGGSGSPSRPRNKGTELSFKNDTKYLMFLDPDNSFYCNSIDDAINNIEHYKNDICVYNLWTYGRDNKNNEKIIRYNQIKSNIIFDSSNSGIESLNYFDFKQFNMQQIIFNNNWYKKNFVKSYEDCIGEDNIFYIEMILKNPNVYFISKNIGNYYNFNDISLTNNINKLFFEKSYLGEKHMMNTLDKNNLIELYINSYYYEKLWFGILSYDNNIMDLELRNKFFKIFNETLKYNQNKRNKKIIKKIKNYFISS